MTKLKALDEYIKSVKDNKELTKAKATLDKIIHDLEKAKKDLEIAKTKDYYTNQALDVINLENQIKFLEKKKSEIAQEYHQISKNVISNTGAISAEYYSKVASALNADKLREMASLNINKAQQLKEELASEISVEMEQLSDLLPEEDYYTLNSGFESGVTQKIFYDLQKLKHDLSDLLHLK